MPETRLGLALIAKDEASTLPSLLASIEGAFDRIVLVNTGSTDDTVELFSAWAAGEQLAGRLDSHDTATFEWCDDFSAARVRADELLAGHGQVDWLCWADCDDEIRGALNLRRLAEQAAPDLVAFVAVYDYAQDDHGNCVCRLRRERLVRAGHGRWQGRIHEAQQLLGGGTVGMISPDVVEWVHRKQIDETTDAERNLRILRTWIEDDPENPRVLSYLGFEELARGDIPAALTWFERYLALQPGWDEERAQVHRRYALALRASGRPSDAIETAFRAIRLLPSWPDSYLTLAEAHYELGEWAKAAEWAREVLRRGTPESMLIVNPLDYSVAPRVLLAGALAQLGDAAGAVEVADEVLAVQPDHPVLAAPYRAWRGGLKRQRTAESFMGCAEVLVAHDEQLKALRVLESAPHYATDWPGLVEMRSQVRERVLPLLDPDGYGEHYVTGGTKPEDMVDDDQLLAIGDALPRCAFLLDGIRELQINSGDRQVLGAAT